MTECKTPEDEFEIYFREAAKNEDKNRIIRLQKEAEEEEDMLIRRGSLPAAVTRIRIEEEDSRPREHNHHQRASSCKTSNKIKPSRTPSPKRLSQSDVQPPVPGNGFLSPLAATTTKASSVGDTTVANTSSAAPQGRNGGSFRRMSRPRSMREFQEAYSEGGGVGGAVSGDRRRSSVNLEETVAAKLKELKELEDENCLVVRQFTTTPKGVIVDRVDSFKRKKSPKPVGRTTDKDDSEPPNTRHQLQLPGLNPHLLAVGDQRGGGGLPRLASFESPHQVLLLGERRVGRTALVTQFMTSEYLAALNTSFEGDTANEKTISVCVDGEETTLHFIDPDEEAQQDHRKLHPDVDCYLLVFSISDRKSFKFVSTILRDLNETKRTFAVIVVANKSDVVRKRQVSETEAKNLCGDYSAKYIEVSAALNHKVDDLLVGIVSQVRLNSKRRSRIDAAASGKAVPPTGEGDEPSTPTSLPCSRGTFGFLARIFSRRKDEPKPCENLQTI